MSGIELCQVRHLRASGPSLDHVRSVTCHSPFLRGIRNNLNLNCMAFFKKIQQKINGKWYPKSVTVGKPVTTKEVSDRLAQISTVSRADTYAVLMELAGVLADYMSQGRTVKLDGLGTFYYTLTAGGNGVESADKVSVSQIAGVRVRFIPEATKNSGSKTMNRSLISDNIFWMELNAAPETTPEEEGGEDRPEIE